MGGGLYSKRDEALAGDQDLAGFALQFNKHWRKAVAALGKPEMVQTVNGWVGELKTFAEEARAEALSALARGDRVFSADNPRWTRADVEAAFNSRMSDVTRLNDKNLEIAARHKIRVERH